MGAPTSSNRNSTGGLARITALLLNCAPSRLSIKGAVVTAVTLGVLLTTLDVTENPLRGRSTSTSTLLYENTPTKGFFQQGHDELKEKRQQFTAACEGETREKDIRHMARHWFTPPFRHWKMQELMPGMQDLEEALAESEAIRARNAEGRNLKKLFACQFAFIDIGAHDGQAIGELIDSGIPTCRNRPFSLSFDEFTVEPADNKILDGGLSLSRIAWLKNRMANVSTFLTEDLYPEHYCYYGVEADPRYKHRLNGIKDMLYLLSPRPLERIKMYTNAVVAESDGTTKFYLDTDNIDRSSLLKTHKHSKNHENVHELDVEAISLSTLLNRHVMAQPGSHVVIKMDGLQGGEYSILNAAYDTGVLCQLASKVLYLDILVSNLHHLVSIFAPVSPHISTLFFLTLVSKIPFNYPLIRMQESLGVSTTEDQKRFDRKVFPALQECGVNIFTSIYD